MTNITKGDFVHKGSLGFDWWDVVEILIDIGRIKPVYGVVVSVSGPDFPEDEPNDIQVIVGSDFYSFGPSDIRKVMGKAINVVSAETEIE